MTIHVEIDSAETCLIGPFDLVGLEKQIPVNDETVVFSLWQDWVQLVLPLLKSTSPRHFSISCYDGTDRYFYTAACEISQFDNPPSNLSRLHIPQQRCLHFSYHGHPDGISNTLNDILTNKIPSLDIIADTTKIIQIYNTESGQTSDNILVEIYVPLMA